MVEKIKKLLNKIGFHDSSLVFQFLWFIKSRLIQPWVEWNQVIRCKASFRKKPWINLSHQTSINNLLEKNNWPPVPNPVEMLKSPIQDYDLFFLSIAVFYGSKSFTTLSAYVLTQFDEDCEKFFERFVTDKHLIGKLRTILATYKNRRPSYLARRFLLSQPWILEKIPLALHPAVLPETIRFLVSHAHLEKAAVSLASIYWLLLEATWNPAGELLWCWKWSPQWQREWPKALENPIEFFNALENQYPGLCQIANWNISPQPVLPTTTKNGINLISYLNNHCGLREAANQLADAAHRCGWQVCLRDVPRFMNSIVENVQETDDLENFDTTIMLLPPELPFNDAMRFAGLFPKKTKKRIGVWYWELECIPHGWKRLAQSFDEIWAPSSFIARSFSEKLARPVIPMLGGLELPEGVSKNKAKFMMSNESTTFLFSFDMGSNVHRKNPLGVIHAFLRAFPKPENVECVIKISRSQTDPQGMAMLQAETRKDGRITLVDGYMQRSEYMDLLASCDCYVSLHRSEGFGLGMAEACLLAKPVIATRYSGNMDFLSSDWSLLVDYKIVKIGKTTGPYRSYWHWADPDIEHAAAYMRWVHENPIQAKSMGQRARENVSVLLNLDCYGSKIIQATSYPKIKLN